jgi:hypothetical protein
MVGSAPVAILGLGLVAVNTVTAGYGADIKAAITGDKTSGDPHKAFLAVGGEIAFVIVLALLADTSGDFATIAVALLVGLWLVWAVTHASQITNVSKALGVTGA